VHSPYRIVQQTVNYWQRREHQAREVGGHRNELHLRSHEQHRVVARAKRLRPGEDPGEDRDVYVYEVEIPDLMPYRTYVVEVKTQNKFKESEWSDRFVFHTDGRIGEESE